MSRMPLLEDFALADPAADADAGPSRDWLDGHGQGFAAGQAAQIALQAGLSAEIAQTLADMGFGYAEARTHLLHALKPLFAVLIGRVLPDLAEASHAGHLVELLRSAAAQDSAAPLELSVHPGRMAALSALLPFAVGLPVILVADPAVDPHGAVLTGTRGETVLDIAAVLAAANRAIAAIFESDDERVSYG